MYVNLLYTMRNKGVGKMAVVRYQSRSLAIEVCLSFNFAVVFFFNVCLFPPSTDKLLGDGHGNRLII